MNAGDIREVRVFTQAEAEQFDALGGVDAEHRGDSSDEKAHSGARAVPGPLLHAALWGLMRGRYPGAFQIAQKLSFPMTVAAGEPTRLEIEVIDRPAPDLIDLAVRAVAEAGGATALEGRTRIRLTGGDYR